VVHTKLVANILSVILRDDHKTGNLMVSAGNLLMKRNFDTEALLQFDPFATTGLLTETESARLMGQA